jgi:hypothetical protein
MKSLRTALLAGLLLALPAVDRADDPPAKPAAPAEFPAGTWKVALPNVPGATGPLWLLQIAKKDGTWEGKVIASASNRLRGKAEKLSLAKGRLKFTLKAPGATILATVKAEKEADKLLGEAEIVGGRQPQPLELEKTNLTSLDEFDIDRERLLKLPNGNEAVRVALQLMKHAEVRKVKPAEVNGWADRAVKSAGLYGPHYQRAILLNVAQVLKKEKGYEEIALRYARQAERGLEPKEPPGVQKEVLDVLADVLKKAGKAEQAKEIEKRIARLDFRIKPRPFAGRKTKSDRVVLVELFTNAHARPCVAANLAFDALGKTFGPSEAIRLQYHLPTPRDPDPLGNQAALDRARFYTDQVDNLPTFLLNGKPTASGGGPETDAPDKYAEYVDAITPLLETPAKAEVKLRVTRTGSKVEITAAVDKLAEAGEEVRLRLALVEEQVAYKGTGGQTAFHHLVRSLPGGPRGVALAKKKPFERTFTIDIEDVRKDLKAFLDKAAAERPFPGKERPLALEKLGVVAWVQNNDTFEVYQAARAEVQADKGEKKDKEEKKDKKDKEQKDK